MKTILCATVLIALFGAFTAANPVFEELSVVEVDDAMWVRIPKTYIADISETTDNAEEDVPTGHIRSRRSPNDDSKKIYIQGNHDRKAGTNVYVQGQARVWQSQNKLNEVHAHGSYGQHFGGPGGRSPPSYGGGLTYTRRF